MLRVYGAACNMIDPYGHKGDFKEWYTIYKG
jgi:hypothetical protein